MSDHASSTRLRAWTRELNVSASHPPSATTAPRMIQMIGSICDVLSQVIYNGQYAKSRRRSSKNMNIPRHIFKTYDIRGLIGEEVTVPLAARVGRGFVTLIQNEHPGIALKIAVGRDMRESSAELQEALMSAMIEAGADVLDVGLVSTPAFYFSVGHTRAHAGVMISASHNPAAYNGFKLTRANAVPVSGYSGIQEVADIIESESFAVPSRVGTRTVVSNVPSLAAEHELAFVGNDPVRKMREVAGPGNGLGAQYLDELFKR